ncbi:MAG: T9SS type A sorting domain-containing protein [Bacteroidia bacterium]
MSTNTSIRNKNITLKIRVLILFMAGFTLCSGSIRAQVQGLQLNYFNLPDTVYMQSLVPVDFSITNTADTNLLGNLKINFLNETLNNVEVPLGGFEAVQFFAPQQERTFTTFVPVEPQYFIEGGNTVVIWPSFIGQPIPAVDSIRINVFVGDINGIAGNPPSLINDYYIQNPVSDLLLIKSRNQSSLPELISIYDASGKLLTQGKLSADGTMDISNLPNGLLIIRAVMNDNSSGYFKIIKSLEHNR